MKQNYVTVSLGITLIARGRLSASAISKKDKRPCMGGQMSGQVGQRGGPVTSEWSLYERLDIHTDHTVSRGLQLPSMSLCDYRVQHLASRTLTPALCGRFNRRHRPKHSYDAMLPSTQDQCFFCKRIFSGTHILIFD